METLSSPENKAELCLRIGDWCLNELERSDHAVAYYQKVLEIDKDNLSALNRLIELYRENEQWEDLAIALAGREVVLQQVQGAACDHAIGVDIVVPLPR